MKFHNPLKYVPVVYSDPYYKSFLQMHTAENKWGVTDYKCNKDLEVNIKVHLMPKETYSKVVKFTKPIKGAKELEEKYQNLMQDMVKLNKKENVGGSLNLELPEGYIEKLENVKKQWKERLEISGGKMLMQFNLLDSLFSNRYVRGIQSAPNEITGEYPEVHYKKISWFKYFLYKVPVYFALKFYCKLNNFYYRKEIEQAKKEWEEETKKFYEVMQNYEKELSSK